MNDKELLEYFSRHSPMIERAIHRIFPPRGKYIPNLHEAVEYGLGLDVKDTNKRGKRLRPGLCILACDMLGGDIKKALPFAAAIELMHNYCLVHDDIEDGDTVRRGRPAVWKRYGLAHGINSGDFMIAEVYRHILDQKSQLWSPELCMALLNLMVETLNHTLTGQTLDINARASTSFKINDYLDIVTRKTGYYLAAPIVGGAMVAGADEGVIKAIRKYGSYMGPLFQIMDDIIDLTAGKGRNEIGADIKEGKRSYLVAYTNEHCSKKESREMFRILDKPRTRTTKKDIMWIKELFEKYDAIESGRVYCRKMNSNSLRALRSVPPRLREALAAFSGLMTERSV
jgi:geranylgeranyl diphosphate synthase type I